MWWNPALLGAEPDWLREPRGRDVNPDVTWIPFVTFWQLTTDMAVGHDPPDGVRPPLRRGARAGVGIGARRLADRRLLGDHRGHREDREPGRVRVGDED